MNSHLSTTQTLELLRKLKTALEDFAARSEKLTSEFRTQTARERQLSERGLGTLRETLTASLTTAEQEHAETMERLQKLYESRKARIGKAYQASKEASLQKVEQTTGARKFELQRRVLQTERERDAGYAQANERLQHLRASLAEENTRLSALENKTKKAFSGYGGFKRALTSAHSKAAPDLARPEEELIADLRGCNDRATRELDRCRGPLLALFRYLPLWILLAAIPIGYAFWKQQSGNPMEWPPVIGLSAGILVLGIVGRLIVAAQKKRPVASLAEALANARHLHDGCAVKAESGYTTEVERVRDHFIFITQDADRELKASMNEAGQARVAVRMDFDKRAVDIGVKHEQLHQARLSRKVAAHQDRLATLKREADLRTAAATQSAQGKLDQITHSMEAEWKRIEADWHATVPPILQLLTQANEEAARLSPPWSQVLAGWTPPLQFADAAKYARLEADLTQVCANFPKDKRLALPSGPTLNLPLTLTYPNEGSILFETKGAGQEHSIGALNNLILRLLANSPPGRLAFTIIDPVGLGQNFAGIMHMADYEEQIINGRIWTQPGQIEEKLAQLNEHMEKVIQMYLRNEYETIAQYNEQAGVIAEKYHFLVVADFPNGFTDSAVRRLLSIVANGPRCGVYTFLHWDKRQQTTLDLPVEDLRKNTVALSWKGAEFGFISNPIPGTRLVLDTPPGPEEATSFIHQVGKVSRDSTRVEVPFEHVVPADDQVWSLDTSSELRVAIGRTGATKLQYLAMGKGTRQHGLVAGKTGSGKSTLFHVIITNLALWCSPDQVEFYLVDFKKGVEFKCYATRRLPHARVVAIESDREFALSVLQRVDDELRRRGDLFRKLGVQDIPGYKRAGGAEPMPRCLLLIDEFQEFFVEDDKIAQTASLLLDRIVRQGRAFGIHVLLGSQTLGGAYTVARSTLGQMVIRVALQCNEADAYLIMEDDNPAPRLLSRPGEAIYNDAAGAVEGNSPFQIVWLSDDTRDRSLEKVRAVADRTDGRYPGPIVFEGNVPAEVRENRLLTELIAHPATAPVAVPRIWLGAPNSIKGPTEAVFERQSGNNLLIVGQREESILAIFSTAVLALSAQYPEGKADIFLVDVSAPGTPAREYLDALVASTPRNLKLIRQKDLPALITSLAARRKELADSPDPEAASPTFVLLHGMHRIPQLRYEDQFSFSSSDETEPNPGAILNELVAEGTRLGFHLVASFDSYNSVNRFFTRKALSEFEMRVVFQMSANDSASLVDSPRATNLGLHRALLYNSQEGYLETFRPYALPDRDWLAATGEKLR